MEINDTLTPNNSDLYKSEKQNQSTSSELISEYTNSNSKNSIKNSIKNSKDNLTHASCNICSTFKCEGDVRQLCGKYSCMKN